MKAIIFNDKENFDWALNRLNEKRTIDKKRFWKISLCHKFIFKKVSGLLKENCHCLELVKTMVYTGEYNKKAIKNVKKSCNFKIKQINELIKKETALLEKIDGITGHDFLKEEVIKHVTSTKNIFEEEKISYIDVIKKQTTKLESQQKLFSLIRNIPFTELRTTSLVTRGGRIHQKGVDAKFSTDLILLAQSNAFDVAILLTGDADLKESIKLVRGKYGKIIFLVSYYSPNSEEKQSNTISEDLLNECDYFINLNDLDEKEILEMSDLKKPKKTIEIRKT